MQHPDEGTIQGWLEEQLPAGDAREVASHVHGCAECQAVAAEIRGLMARTSGIVAALDGESAVRPALAAVPAGAPGAPLAPGVPAAPAASTAPARRRPVALRRWVPALAAAVVVLVVMRQASSRDDMRRPADVAASAPAPVAAAPAGPTEIMAPTAPPADAPAAVSRTGGRAAVGGELTAQSASGRGATDLASRPEAPRPLRDDAAAERSGVVASAPVPRAEGLPTPMPAPAPAPAPPMVAAAAPTSSAAQAVAAPAPSAAPSPLPAPTARAASEFGAGRLAAKAQRSAETSGAEERATNVPLTGCYRVTSRYFSKMFLEPGGRALVVDADTTSGRWSPIGDSIAVRWRDSLAVFPAGVARAIGRYGVERGESRPLTVWRGCPGS